MIAHLSDLHFGREDGVLLEVLREELRELRPALVVVSGDLTQRARRREFEAARVFLDEIAAPKVVVPGNHDIPLFDVLRRLFRPLARYQRQVTPELLPFARIGRLAVLGVNTARPSLWKGGRLSLAQIEAIRERFCAIPDDSFKVLVTHHPFLPPSARPATALVGRGLAGLLAAERCGVDLLLAGHLHVGYAGDVRSHHVTIRRAILVAQAGTLSRRTRGEVASYNQVHLELEPPRLGIALRAWDGRGFRTAETVRFVKQEGLWRPRD